MVPMLLGLASKLNTLLDRLTSTRAGYLDRLDATMSSRASATHYTSARAALIDNLDAPVSSLPGVPVVQTGTLTFNGWSTGSGVDRYYLDVTISEVSSVGSCVCFASGSVLKSAGLDAGFHVRLIDTTTLRVSVDTNTTPTGTSYCRWTVVDYGT